MKHTPFVHLHVHTEYSILESTIRLEDLIAKAVEYNMPAVAMTDDSVFFGMVPFFSQCKPKGIKPLLGAEVHVAPKSMTDRTPSRIPNESFNLVLLVRNDTGYRNLSKMITLAQFEGFFVKPRIDKDLLCKHAEGLVCLSGNMNGEIAFLLLQDKTEEAEKVGRFYLELFGKEHFFLEIQDHGLKQEKILIPKILQLAKNLGVDVVATNDCHYMSKEDSFAHDIARCISMGVTLNDPHPTYETTEYNLKSFEEMQELFQDHPEVLSNTIKVAELCNFVPDFKSYHLPVYPVPEGKTHEGYLMDLCREGMKKKINPVTPEIEERLAHEFKIIKQMGFVSYFLIVWDFVNYSKKNNIPVGPGRGSAAGSLIAYLLGITSINPMKYDLLFERFLNPSRISMPDIDMDFCYDRRTEVIEYVSQKYGRDCVAQIITYGTLAARAVIRDVGRVMGMPYPKVDQIAKLIPGEPKMTLEKAIKTEPQLTALMEEDKEIEALFNNAKKLEGLPRNTSTHAAGIIISKGNLTEKVPLYKGQENETITQFDGPSCEKIGLLKMDFLGLKTLTVLDMALKMANEQNGSSILEDLNDIPINDPKTYDLLIKGNTLGVFQLESSGMRDLIRRLEVKDFADIVALVALYRPGPLQMADDFIQRKHGKVKVEYFHPCLKEILHETHGIMLYQEQVMKCAQVMGDFSLAEADTLRKIMGKKKKEEMKLQRDKFISGSAKLSIPHDIAEKTFDAMEYFAGYGFNKSHSVAYGWIAYQTAWFKANYPKEFMAALLTSEKNDIDKIGFYIEECKAIGVEVKSPSIQYSDEYFTVDKEGIVFGLGAIKNVGAAVAKAIVEKRKTSGPYKSLEDFAKRMDARVLNKKALENLIKAGALDCLEKNRAYLFEIVDDIIRFGSGSQKDSAAGQGSFLDLLDTSSKQNISQKKKEDFPNWPEYELLKFEKELLGFYSSGHPLGQYSKILKRFSSSSTKDLHTLKDGSAVKIGGIITRIKNVKTQKDEKPMAIIQIEDLSGSVEAVLFPKTFAHFENLLQMEALIYLKGTLQFRNEIPGLIADDIIPLDKVQEELTSAVYVRLSESQNMDIFEKLKNIFETNPGPCKLFLDLDLDSGKTILLKLPPKFSISPAEKVIQSIEKLTGEDSVWLHIKDKEKQKFK